MTSVLAGLVLAATGLAVSATPPSGGGLAVGTSYAYMVAAVDSSGDHVDRVLRQLARLERRVTSYYTLSHPAGDPYTRSRLVSVANGLYGLYVDAKHDLLFADALTLISTRQTLWLTAAAAAADPVALSDAERASTGSGRAAEAPRPRLVYRAATLLAIVAVGGSVVGLWYVDHSALSVVFSAVAAPLLVPAVVGLARRGWYRNETEGMADLTSESDPVISVSAPEESGMASIAP